MNVSAQKGGGKKIPRAKTEHKKPTPPRVGDLVSIDNDCGVYQVTHVEENAVALAPIFDTMKCVPLDSTERMGWQVDQLTVIPLPPLAVPSAAPPRTAEQADWLRAFIYRLERESKFGTLYRMKEAVQTLFAEREHHARDSVSAEKIMPEQAAYEQAVFGQARQHIKIAESHLCGTIDDGAVVPFNDPIAGYDAMRALAYLQQTLDDVSSSYSTWTAGTSAMEQERHLKALVKLAEDAPPLPKPISAAITVPEPIANVMRLALDLEAIAERIGRFRKAGGKSAGESANDINGVDYMLYSAATEIRTNVMAELLADPPSKLQVKLSRILAGRGGASEGGVK